MRPSIARDSEQLNQRCSTTDIVQHRQADCLGIRQRHVAMGNQTFPHQPQHLLCTHLYECARCLPTATDRYFTCMNYRQVVYGVSF